MELLVQVYCGVLCACVTHAIAENKKWYTNIINKVFRLIYDLRNQDKFPKTYLLRSPNIHSELLIFLLFFLATILPNATASANTRSNKRNKKRKKKRIYFVLWNRMKSKMSNPMAVNRIFFSFTEKNTHHPQSIYTHIEHYFIGLCTLLSSTTIA